MSTKPSIRSFYLSDEESLRFAYQWRPEMAEIGKVMEARKAFATDRELLEGRFSAQYEGMEMGEAVRRNIGLLRNPDTFTITTGHQLCLLGGPMYMVYKLLTAIRTAEALAEAYPQSNFVPVYWMATEDHDAAEIDHFFLDFGEKVEYEGEINGAVGRHELQDEIQAVFREGIPAEFQDYFSPGKSLSRAYREFIHDLFGQYGLLVLDADDRELKRAFIPEMKAEFTSQTAFKAVEKANARLEAASFPTQVTAREINLFYLREAYRERLIESENGFATVDGLHHWTPEELFAELEAQPERFSPNVVLRPLYQEKLLPNLAYTGGWGELSYWMQFKGVFDAHGIPFPMLLPRFNATLLRPEEAERWAALGFRPEDFHLHTHRLWEKYLPNLFDEAEFIERSQPLLKEMEKFQTWMTEIDPTLGRSVAGKKGKLESDLGKLLKKVRKSIRNQNPAPFREMEALKRNVSPDHTLQERVLNLHAFAGQLPPHELVRHLYETVTPFQFSHQWITLP